MNLFLDETGLIIAKKNDPALTLLREQLISNYSDLPTDIPDYNKQVELEIFDGFYSAWKQHFNQTFISHERLSKQYSVLFSAETEVMVAGIKGMRLLLDIITNIKIPLSKEEQASYDRCVVALSKLNWTLEHPSQLAEFSDILTINEIPRMAYAPQLRSDMDHYHFYNVLSEDTNLDTVNGLFEQYLINYNKILINQGNYWLSGLEKAGKTPDNPTTNHGGNLSAYPAVTYTSGEQITDTDKSKMAKLLFETSYLEFCSVKNKLNLNFIDLQKKQNIDPYSDLIHGVYEHNTLVGFIISGNKDAYESVESRSYYRDEMAELDKKYETFFNKHLTADTYFASCLAITEKHRGKSIPYQVFEKIKVLAAQSQCRRIILTVYENNRAIKLYKKNGFNIIDTFDDCYEYFFDRVKLLEYSLDQ